MPAVDTLISPPSFSAVKLEATLAEPTTAQFRADAERLSHIIMEMQRCFLLHLCKELAPGNVTRASGAQDRRKVMVCITSKGSALVRRIRDEMMDNLMKLMAHLTPSENKAWLQIYTKIYDFCQAKHSSNNRWEC